MSREQQGSQRVLLNKKAYRRLRMRQEEKSGDESRQENSGPRFAGCDGGAKAGLSHVGFGVKATIQSADEESAKGKNGDCR